MRCELMIKECWTYMYEMDERLRQRVTMKRKTREYKETLELFFGSNNDNYHV